MQLVKPLPFAEAVEKLGSRSLIASKLSSSEWRDVPVALRERAFFSARVESARVLQRARDGINDFLKSSVETLPNGQVALATGSRADFVKQTQDFLKGEGIERKDGGLQDLAGERRLGLIFNTQTRQANDFGTWKQGQDPDLLNEFPAQRFIRVEDVEEPRNSHTDFEGQVYLKTDPIWANINDDFGVPWGPWGWGCGHDVEDVDRAEAEALGLIGPNDVVSPIERDFNEGLQASTKGLDPDLLAKLQADFGNKITIEGETIRWTSQPGSATVPVAAPAGPPAPPSVTSVPSVLSPVKPVKPVSEAMQVKVKGTLKHNVTIALNAIDKVHDDGVLPPVPVVSAPGQARYLGRMKSYLVGGKYNTVQLEVKNAGSWPALTTVHEAGHFIDVHGLAGGKGFATESAHAISSVIKTAQQSTAVKGLEALRDGAKTFKEREHWKYFLTPREIWARAYVQFVAEESGDPQLGKDLEKVHQAQEHRQWKAKDFAPIAAEIRKQFKQLGWIK
jgi:hypothetical protein